MRDIYSTQHDELVLDGLATAFHHLSSDHGLAEEAKTKTVELAVELEAVLKTLEDKRATDGQLSTQDRDALGVTLRRMAILQHRLFLKKLAFKGAMHSLLQHYLSDPEVLSTRLLYFLLLSNTVYFVLFVVRSRSICSIC